MIYKLEYIKFILLTWVENPKSVDPFQFENNT